MVPREKRTDTCYIHNSLFLRHGEGIFVINFMLYSYERAHVDDYVWFIVCNTLKDFANESDVRTL